MTAALRDVCPEDFLRAGAVFGEVAEQLTTTIAQSRRSAQVRWTGPPTQAYQKQLAGLVGELLNIQRAYDSACDALLTYSRALVPVRDLAVRADCLAAQAQLLEESREIDPRYLQIVIRPLSPEQEQLQAQAQALREGALEAEYVASSRLTAQLQELASDAPRLSGWQHINRALAGFSAGAGSQISGSIALAAHAYRSLPLVGDQASRDGAREALKQDAEAMAQPWLGIEATLEQLMDGQVAHGLGSLSAGLVMRRWGHGRGRDFALFGAHDDLPDDVLRAMTRGGTAPHLAAAGLWSAHHVQQEFVDSLLKLRTLPLPRVEELITNGADLLLQEAHGGHTLLKHVGRDEDFLHKRQAFEPRVMRPFEPKSSFVSLEEAERLVAGTLLTGDRAVRAWISRSDSRALTLRQNLSESAGLVLNRYGQLVAARRSAVVLIHDRAGRVRILTAYLEG